MDLERGWPLAPGHCAPQATTLSQPRLRTRGPSGALIAAPRLLWPWLGVRQSSRRQAWDRSNAQCGWRCRGLKRGLSIAVAWLRSAPPDDRCRAGGHSLWSPGRLQIVAGHRDVPPAKRTGAVGLQPLAQALLVERVAAGRHSDVVARLPRAEADRALPGISPAVLVSEEGGIVGHRGDLLDVARCRPPLAAPGRPPLPRLPQQLGPPEHERHAEVAHDAAEEGEPPADSVQLGVVSLALARGHELRHEQRRGHAEDVKRAVDRQLEHVEAERPHEPQLRLLPDVPTTVIAVQENADTEEDAKEPDDHPAVAVQLLVVLGTPALPALPVDPVQNRQDRHGEVQQPDSDGARGRSQQRLEVRRMPWPDAPSPRARPRASARAPRGLPFRPCLPAAGIWRGG
mmetsp:Transcript_35376/g.92493  ORF Transcript_35376/g.92493 Transcript_35376/m.92493 type:complete len:400 (-) Transcript_35376:139-1338(-)